MRTVDQLARRFGLAPILLRYWGWTLLITALSCLYTGFMLHVMHSRVTFGPLVLWNPDRWWDFLVFKPRFQHFGTPVFWTFDSREYPFTYPAPMALVFAVLFRIPHSLRWYLLSLVAALAAGAWLLARSLARRGASFPLAFAFALTIPALAWPVWLLLGSANMEGLVGVLIAAGIWAFLRRRWWLASSLFATAGSLKIFPLTMLALLLSRRRYVQLAAGLALAGLIDVASLATLGPTIAEAQRNITSGLVFVRQIYALNPSPWALDVSHSLFSPVKFAMLILYRASHPHLPPGSVEGALGLTFNIYIFTVIPLALLAYFLRIRHLPMLNQLLALSICAVLLPPYSVDYTLIHLFFPLGLLCIYADDTWRRSEARPGLNACFVCFAFIFPIATFFTLYYRLGSLVRMAALCALLFLVMRHPFPSPTLDRSELGEQPS